MRDLKQITSNNLQVQRKATLSSRSFYDRWRGGNYIKKYGRKWNDSQKWC